MCTHTVLLCFGIAEPVLPAAESACHLQTHESQTHANSLLTSIQVLKTSGARLFHGAVLTRDKHIMCIRHSCVPSVSRPLSSMCMPLQVFFYICIINNLFICVLLFLGAGSVFNAATGMSIYACCL